MPQDDDQKPFDDTIRTFRAEIANPGLYLGWDADVRARYARQIQAMSQEITIKVNSGVLTQAEQAGRDD